jgi:3-deoxy-D-manno-octulosonic-acid transferase
VLLADTLGELLTLYAAAEVAFVGGSLVPVGGHNLLEPAALGLAVISGRAVFNAPEVAAALAAAAALTYVETADELADALVRLFAEPERRLAQGVQAAAVVAANRGALTRLLKVLRPLLTSD